MSVIFLEGFLDPDAERLHHGEIVEREEEGFLGGVEIDMLVPHPRGDAENIVRLPIEPLAADDRIAAPARDIIDDVARVAVRLPPESGFQHLHRSEEHTSELQSLMRISYAVFCLKKTKHQTQLQ